MTFAYLSAANVHHRLIDKLQEGPLLALQITIVSVITIHYGKYGEIFEGPEDQLMLDMDEIARDRRDVADARTAENAKDGENTGDVGEIGNVGDAGVTSEAGDKEVGKGNKGGE